MAELPDQICDVEPKQADEERIPFVRFEGFALIERILDRKVGVGRPADRHAPSRGDGDALDRCLAALGGHINTAGLCAHARIRAPAGPPGS